MKYYYMVSYHLTRRDNVAAFGNIRITLDNPLDNLKSWEAVRKYIESKSLGSVVILFVYPLTGEDEDAGNVPRP